MFSGEQAVRGTDESVGYDLKSNVSIVCEPFEPTKIPTGIYLEMPAGFWAKIEGRSSLGLKGVSILGGVIDPDYKGEIMVIVMSVKRIAFKRGDKIAQLVFHPFCVFEQGNGLERGKGGFGSTGK